MTKCYHTKTQEAYNDLMRVLEEQGCVWFSGSQPTCLNAWENYEEKTVIYVNKHKSLTYGHIESRDRVGIIPIEWLVEPTEKIEVSKEFDEWVQKAKKEWHKSYKSWCIWQINKMGWSHWIEEPKTHKPLFATRGFSWTEEVSENKELHTRAILIGYTVKKEKLYEIPLPYLETSDGEAQYLSFKDKKWFASRKNTWLKQQFTELELENMVSKFYRKLAVEVGVV
ncbi:TPA: DUF1642 domain-containing protein [Enterococcus faecalis]